MKKERTEAPDDYVAEIADVDLGDARLDKRCLGLVSSVATDPSAAFPQSIETNAGLEAAYRFFNNERVTPQDLLEPHYQGGPSLELPRLRMCLLCMTLPRFGTAGRTAPGQASAI
jgi:hypothetical protein